MPADHQHPDYRQQTPAQLLHLGLDLHELYDRRRLDGQADSDPAQLWTLERYHASQAAMLAQVIDRLSPTAPGYARLVSTRGAHLSWAAWARRQRQGGEG